MKAFILEKYGTPFREASIPLPSPEPGQVLVRTVAAGINHADDRSRQGEFKLLFHPDLPRVGGGELSGEVVALGDGVTGFSVGDDVIAYTGVVEMGAWAEFAVVEAAALAHAPTTVPLVESASFPVSGLTAWQALVTLGQVEPGQRVLVHGGSGGVGSVTIQLAKHLGATVISTASAANADFVRDLGADEVIDYRTEDFVEKLRDQPVDLVLDTQGGDTTMRSLEVLKPGGLVVGIAGTPDRQMADQAGAPLPVKLALTALSAKLRRRADKLGVRYRFLFIEPDGQALQSLADLVDEGVLKPVVGKVLPFSDTLSAIDQVLSGGHRGKVLVSTTSRPATDGELADQRPATWSETPTTRLAVNGETLVYRDLGPAGGTPVVLLTHLGATLDEWDPAVVDALAADHRVVALGLTGMGHSTGTVAKSVKEMADTARAMIAALGFEQVDLFGFSLGGFVAQQITLDDPALVRRLVLTGTGPAGGQGINRPTGGAYVYWDMVRGLAHRTDAKEFLFFPRTPEGKAAAKDYLARINQRMADRDQPTTLGRLNRQMQAVRNWGSQAPQDLSKITAPTLIANGDHDRMVPTELSKDLHRRIPDSTLIIYPGAGHGGVFQFHEEFSRALIDFLDA